MRLVRRSLLCLVVGVTAFGVAGWGFRPKPTWTAAFRTNGLDAKTFHVAEPNEEAPIWIGWVPRDLDAEPPAELHLQSIDPATGREIASVKWPVVRSDEAVVLATGGLVKLTHRNADGRDVDHFEHFDWRTNATSTFTLAGRWNLGKDRRHMWRLQPIPGGFRFLERALPTGAAAREFDCIGSGGPPKDFTCDVSADGRWFAFLVGDDKAPSAPKLVEVWDVEKGRLFRKLTVPDALAKQQLPGDARTFSLSFKKGRLTLYPPSGESFGSYTVAPETGDFLPQRAAKPAQPAEGADVNQANDGTPKPPVWVMNNHRNGRTAFSVIEGDAVVVPWRIVPFAVPPNVHFFELGVPCAFAAVPRRTHVLCRTTEPSIIAGLPSGVAKLLPDQWRRDTNVHTRWHDWTGSEWRDVGCSEDDVIFQIRPNCYVTRSFNRGNDESELVLQSWPLPPRDPRWPAVGVSALCVAATWWMCAKRYRRRGKLAV